MAFEKLRFPCPFMRERLCLLNWMMNTICVFLLLSGYSDVVLKWKKGSGKEKCMCFRWSFFPCRKNIRDGNFSVLNVWWRSVTARFPRMRKSSMIWWKQRRSRILRSSFTRRRCVNLPAAGTERCWRISVEAACVFNAGIKWIQALL